ncbi:MAG: NFACT family protein [Candidatus Altiarchaeota archaeon]|nr:NFACT family protein [Candidatus Altiarchaeota archaeon]
MKTEFNSVDVRVVAGELDVLASGARFDKAYQIGGKELLVRLFKTGVGQVDLVVSPGYLFASRYSRSTPEKPSSFAMQLRKVLDGGFLRGVRQREFDRIIELEFDVHGKVYFLVAELFGTGNTFLLDGGKKILGLLEWQRWKDRVLGVGKVYEYPPKVGSPLEMDEQEFRNALAGGKSVAAAIASGTGLGGFYAEEVCLRAGVDRKRKCGELSEGEVSALWSAFRSVLEAVEKDRKPVVAVENGVAVDVAPIEGRKFSGMELKFFESFNQAADEYFSRMEESSGKAAAERNLGKKKEKLDAMLKQQQDALKKMREDAEIERKKGDAIYARYAEVEEIVNYIKQQRARKVPDGEILEQLKGRGIVKKLDKYELTLDI